MSAEEGAAFTAELTKSVMSNVSAYLEQRPLSRDSNLEVLTALGWVAGIMLAGCDGLNGTARLLLDTAIERSLANAMKGQSPCTSSN